MNSEQMHELADRIETYWLTNDIFKACDFLRQCAEQQTNSEQWLLDLMGDWDFTLPRRAFEQIVQSITPHPTSGEQPEPSAAQPVPVSYSELGMIRNAEEGRLAGLVTALAAERTVGCSLADIQSAVAALAAAGHYLAPADGARFDALRAALGMADMTPLLSRVLPIVQRLAGAGVLVRSTRGSEAFYARGAGAPPGDVIQLPEHPETARLLWRAESQRVAGGVAAY